MEQPTMQAVVDEIKKRASQEENPSRYVPQYFEGFNYFGASLGVTFKGTFLECLLEFREYILKETEIDIFKLFFEWEVDEWEDEDELEGNLFQAKIDDVIEMFRSGDTLWLVDIDK